MRQLSQKKDGMVLRPLFRKEETSYQSLILHRDVMANILSAVNAIVLLELKTVNT